MNPTAQKDDHVGRKRRSYGHGQENSQSQKKKLAPSLHVPDPSGNQMKNGQGQRINGSYQPQLHGTGLEVLPNGGQKGTYAGHHERQKELCGCHRNHEGTERRLRSGRRSGLIHLFIIRPGARTRQYGFSKASFVFIGNNPGQLHLFLSIHQKINKTPCRPLAPGRDFPLQ